MNQKDAIRRSALWSAYGDAIGFITELADAGTVRRRIKQTTVSSLVAWRRRVGGRFGVDVQLPLGCYSDDTQLRLATGRAIGANGTLDAEVFAKVELTVWRAYALGAGRGTKAAAQSLTKADVPWCGNFFASGDTHYINAGGNGAAMRIQPHVWVSPLDQKDSVIVREIVRNAVITHGHFRGILGAAFHGLCLREALRSGSVPTLGVWHKIVDNLQHTGKIVRLDDSLKDLWVPQWEKKAGRSIDDAINETIGELRQDIEALERLPKSNDAAANYMRALDAVGGFSPNQRGSGTKTSILSAFLAGECCRDAQEALGIAANALGSDTDTIGTMAGAIIGATCEFDPPDVLMDAEYISSEADRMYAIAQGSPVAFFNYPDLLYWDPPKAEADVIDFRDGEWRVAGLGISQPFGEVFQQGGRNPAAWQWFKLSFGQSVLLKRRLDQKESQQREDRGEPSLFEKGECSSTGGAGATRASRTRQVAGDLGVEEAVTAVKKSGFDPRVVGAMLLELARNDKGEEKAMAYAQTVAQERQKVERAGDARK